MMEMNRFGILVIAASAALCFSCVRSEQSGINDANKRYFDAWMKINHPDAIRDGLGIYILDETTGKGVKAGNLDDYPYACISYTVSDLDGNITETTDAGVAKQIGTYDTSSNYYGPVVRMRNSTALSAGQEMVIDNMYIGGTRKAVIPGWFNTTTTRASTEQEYLDNVTGTDIIMTLTLHDVIKDLTVWQIDSIASYLSKNYKQPVDSLKYGFYYIQTQAPSDTTTIDRDATVYINYTGMLLNGDVFDTSISEVAKDAGIYSSSKSYTPMTVTLNEDYEEITTTTSSGSTGSLVKGFSYCVSLMKTGEKGTCIFYSDLGYEASAQDKIPAYSPLRFDIEMIGTENN